MSAHHERGFTLAELQMVIAIVGLMLACAVPSWLSLRRLAAVRSATAEIRSIFHLVRSRAITRGNNTGIKFTRASAEWQYAIYEDGDHDGVRNDDIARGVDRRVTPPRFLWQQPQLASIGLPTYSLKDPDGDRLKLGAAAVQFNRSTICSFSPLGQATPGTIYLTAAGEVYAVRVYGASAKIRTLRYNRKRAKWESR